MSRILIISLVVIIMSCNNHADKGSDVTSIIDTFQIGDKSFLIEETTKAEFNKIQPQQFENNSDERNLKQDSNYVHRNGDTLILTLLNRKTASFININVDDERRKQFFYDGSLDNLNQYLVYASEWESTGYYLIDKQNGDSTYLCGAPIISPNKEYIICSNKDLLAEVSFNGIDLFKIDKPVRQVGEKELDKWGVEEIRWLNDSVLYMQRAKLDTTRKQYAEITDYVKLTMK